MNCTIEIKHRYNTSSNNIWDILKTGNNVDKWFPFIASCDLMGEGVGAKRICKTQEGHTIAESIITIDEDDKIFTYIIDHHNLETPTKNIWGRMQVLNENDETYVHWKLNFDLTQKLDDQLYIELEDGMKSLLQSGLIQLEMVAAS
ncbi:SRPBCC family protein [Aquimarina sp. Aq78]|uniref:SRPBCC family protein n=1 Tax=Aquimarina sp. Aq78 TaxID=1191889 RepID=UPI000D0EF50E|nr:SRPBCC family protein [Aquimarina sp. Aq78]